MSTSKHKCTELYTPYEVDIILICGLRTDNTFSISPSRASRPAFSISSNSNPDLCTIITRQAPYPLAIAQGLYIFNRLLASFLMMSKPYALCVISRLYRFHYCTSSGTASIALLIIVFCFESKNLFTVGC